MAYVSCVEAFEATSGADRFRRPSPPYGICRGLGHTLRTSYLVQNSYGMSKGASR